MARRSPESIYAPLALAEAGYRPNAMGRVWRSAASSAALKLMDWRRAGLSRWRPR
jgi:hypothetical protein